MRAWTFPFSACVLAVASSWLAGTATRASALLADDALPLSQVTPILRLFQWADIPITLWASVPISACAVYFGGAGGARYVAIAVTALVALAASVALITLAAPEVIPEGRWGATLLHEIPSLVAFHITPLFVVLAGCIVHDRVGTREFS